MSDMRPKVSIGLPVHNGENYLREALDSILSQTFRNFEVVISDNASKDSTEAICRDYAAKDHRIRYFRNNRNLGAARNFNLAFELSSGEYFKWAAHDDLIDREFLSRCVSVLDEDPSIVACFAMTSTIDKDGNRVGTYDHDNEMSFDSLNPHDRFRELMDMRHWCMAVFGLIRAEALRGTPLIGHYVGSDRCLLAELGLMGRIFRVREYLFSRRHHPDSSVEKMKLPQERLGWFDSDKAGRLCFPNWRYGLEYYRSARKVPLNPKERLLCYMAVAGWHTKRAGWLIRDLKTAARILLRRSTAGLKIEKLLFPDLKGSLRQVLLRSKSGRRLLEMRRDLLLRIQSRGPSR
jgi:glycosyltransferase involved in cell wall biosynthesis